MHQASLHIGTKKGNHTMGLAAVVVFITVKIVDHVHRYINLKQRFELFRRQESTRGCFKG